MPNLLAHRLFIDTLVENKITDQNILDALRLGTQGPDPLFYYGLMPWRQWHYLLALKKYGNKIHRTNGEEFFRGLLEELSTIDDSNERDIFSAFIFGQMAHLILDRTTHPFIYYFSGFDDKGKLTGSFHFSHANYESNLDASLADIYSDIDFRGRTQDAIPLNKKVYKIIDQHLVKVMKKVFRAKVTHKYYRNSIKNIRSMQRMTNNRFLKLVTGKYSMFNALYTPKKGDEAYLNSMKLPWKNPVSGDESRKSFLDLFNDGINLIKPHFIYYLEYGIDDNILNLINENSYKGVPVNSQLRYWVKKP